MSNPPLLVVLSGPSGVGKDSIIRRLRDLGYPFHFTVTATTRPPRDDEVDGRDYFFLSPDQFEMLRLQGGLLEHACVYGREYGVPKAPVVAALREGHDVIMRTNVEGAATIRSHLPGAVLIFVNAPSQEVLEGRLRGRRSDTEKDIEVRLTTARAELAAMRNFDYVVVNDQNRLDDCIKDVEAIVRAEKCRVARPPLGLV